MINSVSVFDIHKASEIMIGNKETNHNAWISTTDIEDKPKIDALQRRNKSRQIPHLARYFRDVYEESALFQYMAEDLGPTEEDVDVIVSFINSLKESDEPYHLGIHCFAGVSRSSAVALVARVINGEEPKEAINSALRQNFGMWPNNRIIRYATKHIGSGLLEELLRWKAKNNDKLLTPFSDDE